MPLNSMQFGKQQGGTMSSMGSSAPSMPRPTGTMGAMPIPNNNINKPAGAPTNMPFKQGTISRMGKL